MEQLSKPFIWKYFLVLKYLKNFEFQYVNIERKIFSEEYLGDNIEDYKIYCFHGNPKFIRVQKHLEGINGKINNYYDLDWKLTDIETGLPGFLRRPDIDFEKPKNIDLFFISKYEISKLVLFLNILMD